jgi:hypothetical protein
VGLGYEWMRERGGGLAVISASWAGPKGKGREWCAGQKERPGRSDSMKRGNSLFSFSIHFQMHLKIEF